MKLSYHAVPVLYCGFLYSYLNLFMGEFTVVWFSDIKLLVIREKYFILLSLHSNIFYKFGEESWKVKDTFLNEIAKYSAISSCISPL